jgi:GNAT superfamily N-acetyltransferase
VAIEVQPFAPKFTQGIADLIVPIQQDEFGIAITYQDQPDLQDIPGFYQKGAGNFWIATDNGKVVGSVALLDIGNRQAALRKMFVAQSHRGKEAGVAARLLNTLLDHSRAAGLQKIFLGTTDKFLSAHRFYEKHGFQRVPIEDLPSRFPRMAVDTIFYYYDLL